MTALYNLIIFHIPVHQDISDFETIRNMMKHQAPDIEVHIITTHRVDGVIPEKFWHGSFRQRVAARPTVLFSPFSIRVPQGIRGARLTSSYVSKVMEIRFLRSAGFPFPETRLITPGLQFDEAEWGPFTVIKPAANRLGRGVRLVRTKDVRWTNTSALPKDDPWYGQRLLAQRYIDTGPHARCYRVLTVLGRPIYSAVSTAINKQTRPDAYGETEVAANGVARTIALSDERDVIELAKAIHAKKPRLPTMATDIIREQKTGRLFVLEYNSAGYTWHLSSGHGRKQQQDFNLNYYNQFNALATISEALTEATRTRAE